LGEESKKKKKIVGEVYILGFAAPIRVATRGDMCAGEVTKSPYLCFTWNMTTRKTVT